MSTSSRSSTSKRKNPQTTDLPKGDKEPNLNPSIPLYDPALHEQEDDSDGEAGSKSSSVEFKVLIDPSKPATKDNLTSKRFKNITNLVSNGNVVVTIYRQMCIDYFETEGKMRLCDAGHRLLSFQRVMSDQARTQYNQVLAEAREEYTEKVEISDPVGAKRLRAGTIREFFQFQMKHRLLHTEDDEDAEAEVPRRILFVELPKKGSVDATGVALFDSLRVEGAECAAPGLVDGTYYVEEGAF